MNEAVGVNNMPKVVAQQRHGRGSNPRSLDRKSDALPLSHRATPQRIAWRANYMYNYCILIVVVLTRPSRSDLARIITVNKLVYSCVDSSVSLSKIDLLYSKR